MDLPCRELVTEPPETATDLPETVTEPPETATERPETATEPPETATEPPETATEPPEAATELPETATEPPETATEPLVFATFVRKIAILTKNRDFSAQAGILPPILDPALPRPGIAVTTRFVRSSICRIYLRISRGII